MICRSCLLRASALARPVSLRSAPSIRPLSTTLSTRNAAAAAASPSQASSVSSSPASETTPQFGTPLGDPAPSDAEKPRLSSCPQGTILTGLNYMKNKNDPVALADDAYPAWLWRCLDMTIKQDDGTTNDAEAEYSKSKKQRRLAAKRQRALEARLLAEGNLEALAPKIPLQEQSINLPGNEAGTPEGSMAAVEAREELRRAMSKERRAKIKESNYLKGM